MEITSTLSDIQDNSHPNGSDVMLDSTTELSSDSLSKSLMTDFLERLRNNCTDVDDQNFIKLFLPNTSSVNATLTSETLNNSLVESSSPLIITDEFFDLEQQLTKEINSNSSRLDWSKIESELLSSSTSLSFCSTAWDGVGCWPRTQAGREAIIPCSFSLNGIKYGTSENASRLCLSDGSWAKRSDYDLCKAIDDPIAPHNILEQFYNTQHIYYAGYGLSICALSVALWIFLYFKDLRCVRNTIHTNLMITYLLNAICWILIYSIPLSRTLSCYLFVMFTYLMATNFFWMFVEGLYLYILVVKTFSIEFVQIYNYHAIGWGIPAIVVMIWSVTKSYLSDADSKVGECSLQAGDEYDYIYKVPILIVLVVNIFFLCKIMWVLIRKLQNSSSAESKQYRKAAKALLVLIPLLGVGYMLVLVTPSHPTAEVIFKHLQALLVSTQGFTVAVLYCFCNGEVRNSLRHRIERCRLRRGDNFSSTSSYYRTSAYYSRQNAIESQKTKLGNGVRNNQTAAPKRQTYGFKTMQNRSPKSSFSEMSTMQTSFTSMASSSNSQRRASEGLGKRTSLSTSGRCSAPEATMASTKLLFRNGQSSTSPTNNPIVNSNNSSQKPRERRADSCVSFSTNNSTFVALAEKNNNNSNVNNANGRRKASSSFVGSNSGYQSVSNSPQMDERVEIEMKMI